MDENIFEKLKAFSNSEKGERSMEEFKEKMVKEDEQNERNYQRFCRLVESNGLEPMINKMQTHYNSDKYRDREYNMGYEPREPLYDYLLHYFEENGDPVDELGYDNIFTASEYQLDKWRVGISIGQGSFIYIRDVEPNEKV